jgi:hypothetical protein
MLGAPGSAQLQDDLSGLRLLYVLFGFLLRESPAYQTRTWRSASFANRIKIVLNS